MSGFSADQPGAEIRVSPNFGSRIGVSGPDMIVLHYTGMASGEGAESWLCNPESEVSSHYLVHEDGRIVQMVRESDRAWHAGHSSWKGETDINSRSIGIEIVNPGHFLGYPDFPDVQIEAVIALCAGVSARHGIARERILAHSDVAPGRKVDPGEKFPWDRLAAAGVAVQMPEPVAHGGPWIGPGGRGKIVEEVQAMLALYGYGVEITGVFEPLTHMVVEAFQRRFRPSRVDGVVDAATLSILRQLLL
ncbi:N-acetylmuramoyl-L-alanine amidase [Aquibium carbonis]|uniref:N-acetylmuramoyl-L-alanine amidase n=1 Tax=Aquibium carbonis TaxID=2495581 RepID=A0A3S0A829_9HYPH|nr:N-acetylmuramoyl-L-alanine amidase [Aquibium carbonis]RST85970.1 N-acetylmuramoyl-L-alanine amidase [Aquibium carbonis]